MELGGLRPHSVKLMPDIRKPPINPYPPHPTQPVGIPQPLNPGGGVIFPGPASLPLPTPYPQPERRDGPGGPERRW